MPVFQGPASVRIVQGECEELRFGSVNDSSSSDGTADNHTEVRYDVADHVAAVRRHGIEPHVILAGRDAPVPEELNGVVRRADLAGASADLHDATKLAAAFSNLLAGVPS